MSEWKELRLKQIVEIMGDGGTPSTLIDGHFNGCIPWVVIGDIKSEIYDTKDKLTESGFRSCSAKLWDAETIILSTGATIGLVGIAKVPLCTKQGITGIVVNEHAYNMFIKYWFEYHTNLLLRYAQGTTFKEIRTRPLGNLRIQIPAPFSIDGLSEQIAIACLVKKTDIAIDAIEASTLALERVKIAFEQNLMTGKLKPDGLYREEEEFVVDAKIGKVPKDWSVGKFKQLAVLQRGKDLTDNEVIPGDYPVVKSNGVQIYHNEYFVKAPGVITGRSGTIGKVFYIETDFWAHNTSLYIKDFKDNCPKFIYYLINRMKFEQHHAGTTVPTLNRNDVHKVRIAYPSPEVQEQIVSILDMFELSLRDKTLKMAELRRLKQALLQNLITGKMQLSNKQISVINKSRP
ncbi:MAG: restriction endonuclease subunit S [Candidatus Cloacimonetes bacterium]|nr:restriction endonuclease subunit S [Candidatus Cloacimonadota bacterium]